MSQRPVAAEQQAQRLYVGMGLLEVVAELREKPPEARTRPDELCHPPVEVVAKDVGRVPFLVRFHLPESFEQDQVRAQDPQHRVAELTGDAAPGTAVP